MLSRRWLAGVLAGLLAANTLSAQGVNLTEAPLGQRCVRNELTMEFDGKITVKQEGKDVVFPHKANAKHVFVERYLEVNGTVADRAARLYETAERTIRFNNDEASTASLRPARRFLATQRVKDLTVSFPPEGRLTRDEADLTEHFDTLAVPGIVPGKTIEVGKSWPLANHVIAALCGLDGLSSHNVEGTLDAVKGSIAHARLIGKVEGIDKGAKVTLLVNGRMEFDSSTQNIAYVEWKQTESRQQSPISPAIEANVMIRLKREQIKEPTDLNNNAIVPIPTAKAPPGDLTAIDHHDAHKRFTLHYPRDWHVTSPEGNSQLVMRLMERGEFIAQVTVSPWKKTDVKMVMALNDFSDLMARTPGWEEDKLQERKHLQETAKHHHTVYRVVASGELDSVKTWQYFYLVVGQNGEQCIVTFSVVPQHVQRLGVRDMELVRDLVLLPGEKK